MQKTDTNGTEAEWNGLSAIRGLVAATNLVGVITQALVSKTGPLLKSVAARIAHNERIRGTGTVVGGGQ